MRTNFLLSPMCPLFGVPLYVCRAPVFSEGSFTNISLAVFLVLTTQPLGVAEGDISSDCSCLYCDAVLLAGCESSQHRSPSLGGDLYVVGRWRQTPEHIQR